MTPTDVPALRALLAHVYDAHEWSLSAHPPDLIMAPKGLVARCEDRNHIGEGEATAALIAAAVNALPELLDEVERLRALVGSGDE